MTREELGFEAYVVLGNALNVLLNGITPDDQQRLGLPMEYLRELYRWVEPVQPQQFMGALERMPESDRILLAEALRLCIRIAADRADDLLGASASTRAAVLAYLQDPTSLSGTL